MSALRLRYNAARSAHAERARALTEAIMRGDQPTADLVEGEKQTKMQLEAARKNLHEAMTRAISGDSDDAPTT